MRSWIAARAKVIPLPPTTNIAAEKLANTVCPGPPANFQSEFNIDSRDARKGWRTVWTIEHHSNRPTRFRIFAPIPSDFGQFIQPFRPSSRILAHQHETFRCFGNTCYSEWVRFCPAHQTHSRRQYTYPDVLTRPPARVQRGNLDPRKREIRNRPNAGIKYACLEEAEDAIKTVCCSSGDDIVQRDPLMRVNLPVHCKAYLSVNDLPKLVELTAGRNTTKPITCVEKKML